ncbi:MAG TPA: hypothetical protein VFC78_06160 [Tepidisphaeraceae bacterium]|nr:hypothetical protein [Tepidisphaeraceae bacterium]
MAKKKIDEYPEIQQIIDRLNGGKPHELIAIFIPSHDRRERGLLDKALWEKQALDLFAKLFTGATAFTSLSGVYQPKKEGRALYDNPTMIQSLTATENIMNEANLMELAEFCHHMGRTTNQASIGVVINNKFVDIIIKHDA